mmetsp:Transcript_23796/g.68876  ORF Transcript_23796/g.68876 Transcript_23796/m.68876 type:complete len:95 (+) Transcript_23796:1023-1307(+)
MQLTETMAIHRLDTSFRKNLCNFHPCSLEFGLVITFTTETCNRDVLFCTVFLDSSPNFFALLLGKFPCYSRHAMSVPILPPFAISIFTKDTVLI